ncbi:MAG: hypothetical protein KDK70_25690, partial [Myxococcales bacterium]|nr:hypothetical protein [Myxococcales bacterium]
GRAHVQWELRHGALERVRATVADLGEDLVVEGRDVARWSRTGDTLDVELNAPVGGRVELELRWSQAVPPGDEARLPVPRIEPDAWRSESSLQLARDGEIEVIPAAEDWTAVAAAELPPWGQGLVEGTPTAAYQRAGGTGAGHLELLRFIPVPGPPTVVDVAAYTMATTEEGRVLMKAYYEVRNDRGAHLTVRPPEGLHIIGARVAGETALPSRGDGEAWRIPLKRSLETVEGLLSFPVEVILIGEQAPWARHEQRELALPTLDAPIAASRVTLHLPPRYRSRLEEGEHNVVGSFGEGEGLTYGRGVGEVGAAEADALFQSAVEGYLDNDFAQAQAKLEQLEQLGVSNENMVRLQANLDVIEGKEGAKDKGDRTLERRVKEQAKARATDEFRQQEVLIAEAEQAASAGDYERAELQYQAAIEIGGKLAKLEQTESVEQDYRNEDLAVQLQSVSGKKDEKKKSKKGKLAGNRRSVFKSRDATTSSSIRYDADPSFDGDGDEDWDEEVGGDRGELTNVPRGPMPGSNLAPEPAPPKAAPQDGPASEVTLGLDAPPPDDVSIIDANGIEDPGPGTGNMVSDVVLEDMPLPEPEPEPEPMLQLESEMFARSRRQPVRRLLRVIGSRARERRTVKYKRAPARGLGRGRRGGAGSEAPSGDGAVFYDFADDGIDPSRTMPQDVEPAKSIERLAAPEVTASALSVVIPATGLTVRYEQLLLDANQTQTVTIDARRRRGR